MSTTNLTRWTGKVGAFNRSADYAMPFTVIAATREEATTKAIELGGYHPQSSRVWIHSAEAVEEPQLNQTILAQAWRDGYYAAKRETGRPTDHLSMGTLNPYEKAQP